MNSCQTRINMLSRAKAGHIQPPYSDYTGAKAQRETNTMKLAVVGCGYVAEHYIASLRTFPQLEILGVFDVDGGRASRLAAATDTHQFDSLSAAIQDPRTDIIVNLTNPKAHYEVIRESLTANKHVYTEKPLTLEFQKSKELANLAIEKQLRLASAPCTLLSRTAQTLWYHVQNGTIGQPLLVLAELNDGYMRKQRFTRWMNRIGVPWPFRDEFRVGCTLEHSAYYLSWLAAIFGPAMRLTAFSSELDKSKNEAFGIRTSTPDISIGCIKYANGVVARMTTSAIAPHDRSLKIIGEDGVLSVKDAWDGTARVWLHRRININRATFLSPGRPLAFAIQRPKPTQRGPLKIEFGAGVNELSESIKQTRDCRLNVSFSLHINELALALNRGEGNYQLQTTFDPIPPLFEANDG